MLGGSANATPNRTRPLSNTVRTPTAKDCLGKNTGSCSARHLLQDCGPFLLSTQLRDLSAEVLGFCSLRSLCDFCVLTFFRKSLATLSFPKQSLAVGVLTVLLRGLVLFGVTVALPWSIFYCNLQYLVTPTFKTPGKVNNIGELLQKTLIFTMKY